MDKPLFLVNRDLARRWKRNTRPARPSVSYDLHFPEEVFNRHVGIEIEVERCGNADFPDLEFWQIERDGSLRGEDAREFKTMFPCTCADALDAMTEFTEMVAERRGKNRPEFFSFSERTSIHIHVDVRDLTEAEIKSAVKLYMIFERSLFDLVGRERRHNIFCIPLSESNIFTEGGRKNNRKWYQGWEKYSALNLAPMATFGTMEFRGMAGNDNRQLIEAWMLLLASLVEYAAHTPPAEVDAMINTLKMESQYMQLASSVFGGSLASLLTIFPEAADSAASLTKLL